MSDVAALFRRLTQGVYVVGAAHGGRRDAFTAAWVMQVSFDPLLIALSVNPGNATAPLIFGSGRFTLNVLGREQLDLARRFGTRSGRDEDKLVGIPWRPGPTGAPILVGAVGVGLDRGGEEIGLIELVGGFESDADAGGDCGRRCPGDGGHGHRPARSTQHHVRLHRR